MNTQEISFYDIAVLIKQHRKIVAITMMVTTLLALAVALFSTPVYRASIVLAPVSTDSDATGVSSLAGSLGGLANLAGLAGGEGGSIEQNIAVLRSRVLADRFITENDLRQVLFADTWDAQSKKWKAEFVKKITSVLDGEAEKNNQQKDSKIPNDGGPSEEDVYRKFDGVRSVKLDKETGLITLSMEWKDPELAASWANQYSKIANEYIRAREIAEANKRLQFLSDQFRSTFLTEVQNAISGLMENEIKHSMIANVREEFAFKIIDPAVVPELRVWPKRGLIVFIGLVGGFMLGISIILIQNYYKVMHDARQG